MPRVSRGQETLIDINDGINPITVFMSNQNHTFSASTTGTVLNRTGFESTVNAFVGQTQATQVSSLSSNNTYTVSAAYYGTASGWGTPTITTVNSQAKLTIPSITDTATKDVIVRLTITVRNELGNDTTITTDVTLNIVQSGAGGVIVEMTTTGQAFRANESGTVTNDGTINPDVVMTISTQGTTGSISFATSINGAAFVGQSATGAGLGSIAAYDNDSSGTISSTGTLPTTQNDVERLLITRANFGNSRTMAIRVSGANGGLDTITLFRVDQGNTGEDAILVDITSNNGNIFVNSTGTAKTLTANVIDSGTGVAPSTAITFTWTRSGSGSVSAGNVRTTSSTDRTVIASGGVQATGTAFSNIIIGAEDVDSSEVFTCTVSVADS